MLVAINVDVDKTNSSFFEMKKLENIWFQISEFLPEFKAIFSKLSFRIADVTIFVLDSFLVSSLSNNIGSTLAGLPAQSIVPQFHAVLFIVSWKKWDETIS